MNPFMTALSSMLLLALSYSLQASTETSGKLIIAGGAISKSSTEIFDLFVKKSGGKQAKIGIIPAATGSIGKQYSLLEKAFTRAGVSLASIHLLPLATKDDKKTKPDEGLWIHNGNNKNIAQQVESLTGIWFIGGDQTLITKVLLNEDGSDTKVLRAIRQLYINGGVIGGTSAGAAIMSESMIAGGNSQGALFEGIGHSYTSMDEQEYGPVVSNKGLGFFSDGIIDQHFDRKGRLGRLVVTLLNNAQFDFGFGVDEGTAMLVEHGKINVIGEGGVTIVDVSSASDFEPKKLPVSASNIRLSFLQPGDSFDLSKYSLTARENAAKTVNHEYFNIPAQSVSGLVNANRNLDEFIGYDLLDNQATNEVSSWVINGSDAIKMTFSQDNSSQGYWSTDVTADVYSFENVRMDIKPIKIQFLE
ncbi:MAG: cyanophycinase [Gammaproteobacteria bacterium]|nr:cyanophycinase [Gammaproteobacteria bacterium]